jgi:hypothetical protein
MTLAITVTEKSQYVIMWVKSHPAPSQPLNDCANPLSTFLGTSASALKSLMTLAITGTEKSQYVIIWVKSHPAPSPTRLEILTPRRPFLGPRQAS